jgi:hypothetical protein
MNIKSLFPSALLKQMIESGYVTQRQNGSVSVLNYSNKAQYEAVWNEVTLQCRGLVIDNSGEVLARPFKKFFNFEQLDVVPDGNYEVYEKLDGSLGIIFADQYGKLKITTRGNPLSWQSHWASERLLNDEQTYEAAYELIKKQLTPLVEIITPTNKIVVDYGSTEKLPLVGLVDIETGADKQLPTDWPDGTPLTYPNIDLQQLLNSDRPNAEGYVIKWENGVRAKIKHPTYIKLHKIIFNCSEKTVWELLKDHKPIKSIIHDAPPDIQQWMKKMETELNSQFSKIERQALNDLDSIPRDATRANQAKIVKTTKYPGLVFAMLDSKPYAQTIWNMIKPSGAKTIATERNEPE